MTGRRSLEVVRGEKGILPNLTLSGPTALNDLPVALPAQLRESIATNSIKTTVIGFRIFQILTAAPEVKRAHSRPV